jgi:hypothetical protein
LIALCRSPAIALVQGVKPSIGSQASLSTVDRDVMSPAVSFPATSIVGQREDYALSDEVRRGIVPGSGLGTAPLRWVTSR